MDHRLLTLSLLVGALIAGAASAQQQDTSDPVWIPLEEPASGCAAPTLQQCSDGAWLYSDDPCAIEQNAPDSECAALLYGDMESRAEDGDEELFIVARSLEPMGVRQLIRTASAQIPVQPQYVADLYSITSKKAGGDYVGADQISADLHAMWDENGAEVTSCREYAYEKFYDLNEYHRHISSLRDDYGRAFGEAYGPAHNDWAIGSRHLYDAKLRGKDGRSLGYIFTNANQAKNELFRMPNQPLGGAEAGNGIHGPGLLTSLAAFHQTTAARLAKVSSHKQDGAHLVKKSWLWQKQMKDLLSYEPSEPDVFQPAQILAPDQDTQSQIGQQLGFANGPQARKRLFHELDELYDLQQRLKGLIAEWGELDLRFVGSGWTVEDAGLEADTPELSQLKVAILPQGPSPVFQLAANVAAKTLGPVTLAPALQIEQPETVLRRRVLEEIVEVIALADAEGCLEQGATPCDWSPKQFLLKSLMDFSAQEDERFDWCEGFTGGSLSNVLDLNIVVVEDPQYYCDIVTGSSITAAQLDALEDRVEDCRQAQIAYQEMLQIEEAKNRVRQIPELVDPATGGFKLPGIDKSRDEYMGNKYFGLGYDYGFGFGMEVQSEICTINMHAGGHLEAYTKVLGQDVSLLDAAANANTEAREVHVHGKVLGIELFQGIDETWGAQEDFHFNIVKKPNKKKEQTIINTTIVVVIVPITIELGISGELGASLGITLDIEGLGGDACPTVVVGGLVEPYLAVNGFVSAAIDIFIAAAGVRGDVNIITVKVPFRPGIGLAVIGDMNGDLLPDALELQVSAKLDLVLETLTGKIFAFAEIGFCPFCYTGEYTIVEWTGPRWEQNLFDQVYKVNLVDLDSAFNL